MLGGTRGTGNELIDVLMGSVGANKLEGGAGNDTLMGGFGQVPLMFLRSCSKHCSTIRSMIKRQIP